MLLLWELTKIPVLRRKMEIAWVYCMLIRYHKLKHVAIENRNQLAVFLSLLLWREISKLDEMLALVDSFRKRACRRVVTKMRKNKTCRGALAVDHKAAL